MAFSGPCRPCLFLHFSFLTQGEIGGPPRWLPLLRSGSSDAEGFFSPPDIYFPSRLDTRERAPEVVYKPENSSLCENVRQHMSAEDSKVDAVISVVGVGAILFFPISS